MTTTVTRLHISPLTPDLLPAILGSNLGELAADISYHSLQSFPDRSYGYINLPNMEADKVKKKLNGAILKGRKMKVEEARPSKRRHTIEDELDQDVDKVVRKSKKSKVEEHTVEGRELSPDRKIKRGWTEPKPEKTKKRKDKSSAKTKSQASSKYTEKEELLFRTQIPKNKTAVEEKSTRKRKKTESARVVHEFEKSTTIPSFLRTDISTDEKEAVGYRDGEGWVDEAGDLVEPERRRVSKRRDAAKAGLEHQPSLASTPRYISKKAEVSNASTSVSESTSSLTSEQSVDDDQNNLPRDAAGTDEATEETSSSGTSGSDSASESESESNSASSDQPSNRQGEFARSNESTPPSTSLHPLEALFKKPLKPASFQAQSHSQDVAKPSLEVQTAFSFFDRQDNDNDLPTMPMTPFTTQDWHSREIRSAAPTPDTAHPSRMSSVFNGQESEEETSDVSQDEGKLLQEPAGLQVPQTDFEKRFWEERGENNRAWKARRRAVLKEKRQRDNRARRPKNW